MFEEGGIVLVEKKRLAGVGSRFPSLSSAETQKTWPRTCAAGSTGRRSVVSCAAVDFHFAKSISSVSLSIAKRNRVTSPSRS
jgi:hypothetical protein